MEGKGVEEKGTEGKGVVIVDPEGGWDNGGKKRKLSFSSPPTLRAELRRGRGGAGGGEGGGVPSFGSFSASYSSSSWEGKEGFTPKFLNIFDCLGLFMKKG